MRQFGLRVFGPIVLFLLSQQPAAAASTYAGEAQLPARYQDVKKVAAEIGGPFQRGWLDYTCSTLSVNLGALGFSEPQDVSFLDVAGAVLQWREHLREFVEGNAWQAPLYESEKALVELAMQNPGSMLVDEINLEVSVLFHKLVALGMRPQHYISDGCGAGGYIDVAFKTDPKGGVVSIISEFDYKLCQLERAQDDTKQCKWRVAKEPESVSGVYYIQVTWPDRIEGPRRYDLNPWSGEVKDEYWLRFP